MRRFLDDGLPGLREAERSGRPRRLTPKHYDDLETILRSTPSNYGLEGNLWDGKTLAAFVKNTWGITLGVRQCQRIFRQLGFRLRTPRPEVAGADAAAKAAFKKTRPLLENPDVDVWSMDEVLFQQAGSRCRMWVPPEVKDPVVKHASNRFKVGYFEAVRLRDGALIVESTTDSFNVANCWAFLRRLRTAARRSGRRVVVITDNAAFHHAVMHEAWRAKREASFQLLYLPPYSADLNPIERVWKLTRRRCTHNVYFATLQEVRHAVETQFTRWRRGSSALRSLCAMS